MDASCGDEGTSPDEYVVTRPISTAGAPGSIAGIMCCSLLLATCTSTSAVKNFLPPGRANHSGVVSKREGVGSSIETVPRGRR